MKYFLREILLFVIMFLSIAVVGDIVVSRGLRKTTIRPFAVWNDLYNDNNLNNDLVFIGASSCWSSYSPMIFDSMLNISTYNLGIDGHVWYPCQPLRYYTYLRYAIKKPKYIVINIDMGTFGTMKEPMYDREQFFPYFWLDDSLVSQVKDMKNFTLMERYCPIWRYVGYRKWIEVGMASSFGKEHFEDDGLYKGYRGEYSKWDRASLNTMDSVIIEYESAYVDSLLQFIALCRAEGQKVVLVKNPVYHELQERFTNRDEMRIRYDSIANVAGVELLDYWNHPIVHDTTYFVNSTHLNKKGSDLISVQLAHDLDSIGFIKR